MTSRAREPRARRLAPPLARRLALASASAGVGGGLAYVAMRAWVHARVGASVPLLVIREQRVGYYQALFVAGFLTVAIGLAAWDAARDEARRDAIERALARAALPVLLVIGAACFAWP